MTDNLRGIILMVASMAGFAIEDVFIKSATHSLPTGQILVFLGLGGALLFAIPAKGKGVRFFSRQLFHRAVIARNLGEMTAALGFITALSLTTLSSTSAILQATPLMVTLGAALFLGETVGWRRWSAICVGFAGVLMIIRPGMEGFQPASLFAVVAAAGIAVRDLATRHIPKDVSTSWISAWAFLMLVPAGVILIALGQTPLLPSPTDYALLLGALIAGGTSYYAIVLSTRIGDMSVVTPFRYTRLIFALILGMVIFAERPDGWTLAGAAVIIASGLYTLNREMMLRRRARRAAA